MGSLCVTGQQILTSNHIHFE